MITTNDSEFIKNMTYEEKMEMLENYRIEDEMNMMEIEGRCMDCSD